MVADGRYVVEQRLGGGGMASVYRIRHVELGTHLALKVLTRASPDEQERLLREGRAQGVLRHTHIASVVDVVRVEGFPALVMEYVDGPSLDWLVKRAPLTVEQVDDLRPASSPASPPRTTGGPRPHPPRALRQLAHECLGHGGGALRPLSRVLRPE